VSGPAGVARVLVVALGAYWLAYCLVAPVTVTDAHMYSQSRLYVIAQDGFAPEGAFANWYQLSYPWTFDAVHWPFLWLGTGAHLPSFACLVGILLVTFAQIRARTGTSAAWLAVLALLALPTLVYQGTSTKNDVAVVFGAFCWFHALDRFARAGRWRDLALAAVAMAFAAGAKTSGVLLLPFLGLATLWRLRRQPRALAVWLGALAVGLALLGSGETYLASRRAFGNALGPTPEALQNRDGIAGGLANVLRYGFANVDPGTDVIAGDTTTVTRLAEEACRHLLRALGLENRGGMLGYSDQSLLFRKTGQEASDGYGPVGTIALLLLPVILLRRPVRRGAWRLAATSVLLLVVTSMMLGYVGEISNRYLLLPFVLATLAATVELQPLWRRSAAWRWAWVALLAFGALSPVLFSFDRTPRHVWMALADRDTLRTLEQPSQLPILRAVEETMARCPEARWAVVNQQLAWQTLFYEALGTRASIVGHRQPIEARLAAINAEDPSRPMFVLALEQSLRPVRLTELGNWDGPAKGRRPSRLYRYGDVACARDAAPG
jgi:hypothetical protein